MSSSKKTAVPVDFSTCSLHDAAALLGKTEDQVRLLVEYQTLPVVPVDGLRAPRLLLSAVHAYNRRIHPPRTTTLGRPGFTGRACARPTDHRRTWNHGTHPDDKRWTTYRCSRCRTYWRVRNA
ncbi:hypothetical protein [Kitasatospora viridis]|uniref:Uncharacterized protein n=1 Tax=Kitasatospora viridis TaxID=281105 RepID=A0A561SA63_9ACTN|nr:hypothetical protein [Kitasatospora viridis]TWF71694.1 hypothetical protein FHX73_1865 [Kitasatospora viridis]